MDCNSIKGFACKYDEMDHPHMMWVPDAETLSRLSGWTVEESQKYLEKNGHLIDYKSVDTEE